MSTLVRAVLLRAGTRRPEWIEIDAGASGPELSSVIGSSQPECMTLGSDLVLWYDGTPFSAERSELGTLMHTPHLAEWTGAILIVGSRDPRDTSSPEHSAESDAPCACNQTPARASLATLFVADFVAALYE